MITVETTDGEHDFDGTWSLITGGALRIDEVDGNVILLSANYWLTVSDAKE